MRAFWAAFAAALILRLLFPGVRPLHHDEGMAAWLLAKLFEGHRFAYDPERFHGPFLIFFTAPFAWLLGESDFVLRLPAAVASAAMVPLLLPLRRRLGVTGITAAAWLLALSPSFVAYGRDLIPETFLVFFTLAVVVAASEWLAARRPGSFVGAAFCLGLLATVKETYALTLVILAVAGFAVRPRVAELWNGLNRRTAILAVLAFGVPYVLLYTSFFTNPQGLLDSFRTFSLWAAKGIAGAEHAKPWDYFPRLLVSFELVTVLCAVAGGWIALRRRDAFGTFCALWAAGELIAYSVLRYKTPWLGLNVLLPAALTAGVLFRESFRPTTSMALRAALIGAFSLGLIWMGWRAVEVSFLRFDDDRLALVYVPTHRDVKALVAEVREAARWIPAGEAPSIRILGRHAWPLPWYLRDLPGMEYRQDIPRHPDGDVLIVQRNLEPRLRPLLRQRYQRREFLLRPRVPVAVYVAVHADCMRR
ncbi:MAG TPA: flippase activity-associated protein Agl23 [Thermoanaerobaculia bacterium]